MALAGMSDRPNTPNWAHAPRNATHWGGNGPSGYLAAWYTPNPSEQDSWYCMADYGIDVSAEEIGNERRNESDRPLAHLIPRPASTENDIENW